MGSDNSKIMKTVRFLIKIIKKFQSDILNFGFKVSLFSCLFDIVLHLNEGNSIREWVVEKKHKAIKSYLKKKYIQIITPFVSKGWVPDTDNPTRNNYVWVCWWQGETDMDELTSCCLRSIRHSCLNANVIVITKNNYSKYISIPQHIIDKLNNGTITITHFSDILRMNLLYSYGGLWLDATMYVSKEIPEEIFRASLFSQKGEKFGSFVSNCMWSGFFIAGFQYSLLFDYMKTMFAAYWQNENKLIDYYLIDYFISIGYELIPEIKNHIDNVPYNNPDLYALEAVLNNEYDELLWSKMNLDTSFYKLSRKAEHIKYTTSGNETFYGHILNQ